MMWLLLWSCAPQLTVVHSEITTVRTNVNFIGTPLLTMENGDVFRIETAAAVLYSVRFLECAEERDGYSFVPINTADAGHSDIFIPTNWNRPTYIDLLDPTPIQTELLIEPQSICLGAVTWARWDGGTFDLPSEEPEATFSMLLSGSCTDSEGDERSFSLSTSIPSEKIAAPTELDDDGASDTLNFTVVFDTTHLLHKIECSDDLLVGSSSQALQALFNIQNNAHWIWEWKR